MLYASTIFVGSSGKEYKYWIYEIGEKAGSKPANYMFVKESSPGWLEPVFIGQTSDIKGEVFENHPKWPCILRNQPTQICVHKASKHESERVAEMNDLIQKYKPDCNESLLPMN